MTSSSARAEIWEQTFGCPPRELSTTDATWLLSVASSFASHVLKHLAAGNNDTELVEDLARVINIMALENRDESPSAVVKAGLKSLIDACLRPEPSAVAVSSGSDGTTDPSLAAERAKREQAITAARSILLRVKNGDSSDIRFPKWVQDELLLLAFEAIRGDVIAYASGEPSRARDLALMLAANYAAFRDLQHKTRFVDLLAQLCHRSEDYMDPFLRDLVFIAQRIIPPSGFDEPIRPMAGYENSGGDR